MRIVADEGRGVVVVLRQTRPTFVSDLVLRRVADDADRRRVKEYGVGAQILLDLGIKDMILLTDTPEKEVVALDGYGLNIVGTHPIRGKETPWTMPSEYPDRRSAVLSRISRAFCSTARRRRWSAAAPISTASSVPGALEIPAGHQCSRLKGGEGMAARPMTASWRWAASSAARPIISRSSRASPRAALTDLASNTACASATAF